MLRTLFVKDFAIIDGADVNFASGMSVLTGETGAGSPSFWISRVFKSLNLL